MNGSSGRLSRGFDRLARPYRWMEYLSFGRALERCRFRLLPQLTEAQHALVLGDGDGRFTARLLQTNPAVQVEAVDGSEAMLTLLQQRCSSDRVGIHHADLSHGLPGDLKHNSYDLITTHFFLDCLTTAQVVALAQDVRHCATSDARWVISEFTIPQRGVMQWPARFIVRWLYICFRLLTGLRPQQLPNYGEALQAAGFTQVQRSPSLGGLLVSEMWQKQG